MDLKEAATALQLPCDQSLTLNGVATDSRLVQPGQLFVALKGERYDGHQFVEEAIAKGAAAVLIQERIPHIDVPQLIVPDTLAALAQLASAHRQTIDCQVIALTGSNGKTSVKEMIAAILPKPSYATAGNLNNHIGVPLSVLALRKHHQYSVFELGANHPGEIRYTAQIVKPQVALINNIAPAHIEGFGSIDGVAHAKGEIYECLSPQGTAVLNDDDNYAHFWDYLFKKEQTLLRFSAKRSTSIYARDVRQGSNGAQFVLVTPRGEVDITLQVPGIHQISNALAAASCAYAVNIDLNDIACGLNDFKGVAGRLTFLKGKKQARVIDDSYNANLRSTLIAIEVLAQCKGRRIFVLGDMLELGRWSEEHHQTVGKAAREKGIDMVFTYGQASLAASTAFGSSGKHYQEQTVLVQDLLKELDAETTVLVKGSKSSFISKIIPDLLGE